MAMAESPAAVAVDVEDEESLVLISIKNMLADQEPQRREPFTIFRVREKIRNEDPGAYNPQIVSFGPFHRGKQALLEMERLKRQFLIDLINRHPANTLKNYIKVISTTTSIAEAQRSYSEHVISGHTFVEMMVIDGCFIVEYLIKKFLGENMGELDLASWNRLLVENDLILLENQIPFHILRLLFHSSVIPGLNNNDTPVTLAELAVACMVERARRPHPIPAQVLHLLHLLHTSFCPTPRSARENTSKHIDSIGKTSSAHVLVRTHSLSFLLRDCRRSTGLKASNSLPRSQRAPRKTPNASELKEAGVIFQVKEGSSFLDVTFDIRAGIMQIPLLSIHDVMISEFRNMVAFEESSLVCGSHFTAYATLMASLMKTPHGVALLERNGILEFKLGGDEEITRLFNSIAKRAYLDFENHYLVELFKDVKEYCATDRHRWRAKLVRDYFSNPWSIVSLFAAFVLLVLTILQTFFAVFSYFHPL